MGLWTAAVACFVLAAAAGTLFRFGPLVGLPWGLEAGNLRHAHSHLMFFSWVTPAIMALWTYARIRGNLRRTPALRLFEISLMALGLSTAGAWSRAALQFVGSSSPILQELAVQLFLGAFTHGWLIVGTLGLAVASVENESRLQLAAAPWLLLLGLPGVSLVGSARLVGDTLGRGYQLGIELSALVFAVGLGWCAWRLAPAIVARRRGSWLPFLIYLLLTAVSLALSAVPDVLAWAERAGLYLAYLHLVALGVASTGLVTAARERWGWSAAPSPWSFGGAVALLLAGVFSLTPLWPMPATPTGRLVWAAWTSIPPIAVLAFPLIFGRVGRRMPGRHPAF